MRNEILTEIYRLQSLMGVDKSILIEGTITDFFKTSPVKNLIKKGVNILENSGFGKYIDLNKFEPTEIATLRSKYGNKLVDDIISDASKFDEFLTDVSKGLDESKIIREFINSDAAKSIKTELDTLTTNFKKTAEKLDSQKIKLYKDEILKKYKESLEKDQILGTNENSSIRDTLVKDLETKLDSDIVKIKAEKELKNIEREILQTSKAEGRNTNPLTWLNSNFKFLAKYWYYVVKSKFGNKILYETNMMVDLAKINEAFKKGKSSIPILEDLLSKFYAKYYEGNIFETELEQTLRPLFNKMKGSQNSVFNNVDEDLINKIIDKLKKSPKLKTIFNQEKYVDLETSNVDLFVNKIIPWSDLFNPILRKEEGKKIWLPAIGAWARFLKSKSVITSQKQLELLGSMNVSDRVINFASKQILNWFIFPGIISLARTFVNNWDFIEEMGLNKIKEELSTYKAIMETLKKLKDNPNIDPKLKETIEKEIKNKEEEFKKEEENFKKELTQKIIDNYIEALPITGKPYGSDSIIAYLIKIPMCMTYIDEVSVWIAKYIWSLIVGSDEDAKKLVEIMNGWEEQLKKFDPECKKIFDEKVEKGLFKDALKELETCVEKTQTTEVKFKDEDTEGTEDGLKKYLKSINKEYKVSSFNSEQKFGESTDNIVYLWDITNKWHPQQN